MANHIPCEEFQERLKSIREAMLRQKFDALVVFSQKRSHITYLSGYYPNYHTNAALMLITAERDPTLWIKFAFDLPRAKATSWLEDIRTSASYDGGERPRDDWKMCRRNPVASARGVADWFSGDGPRRG